MKPDDQPRENRQAFEEAAAWFVDFRVSEPDRAERQRFVQWLKRSPENIRAYVEIAGTYVWLPRAHALDRREVDRLIARARERERSAVVPLESSHARSLPHEDRPWAWHRWAASLAAFAVLAIVLWAAFGLERVYTTGSGEQRLVTLEDGSRLELNAHTRLRVDFTDQVRGIDLLEGQALFHVSKDPDRPFVVRSGAARVRAVGTQFDVNRRQSGTTITVIEGRVAVQRAAPQTAPGDTPGQPAGGVAPAASVELHAGEQVVVTRASVSRLRPSRPAAAIAWTQGEIEFDETPLADAIEDFNRQSRIRLVLDGPPPDGLRISGVYSSQGEMAFVRFLSSQPDLEVVETAEAVHIRRR